MDWTGVSIDLHRQDHVRIRYERRGDTELRPARTSGSSRAGRTCRPDRTARAQRELEGRLRLAGLQVSISRADWSCIAEPCNLIRSLSSSARGDQPLEERHQNSDRDGDDDEVWLLERAEIIVAFRLEAGAAMNGIVSITAPAEPGFALSHDAWRSWNRPEKLASADAGERRQTAGWCPGAESNHRHCDFQSHALPTELPGRAPKRGQGPSSGRFIVGSERHVHPASPSGFVGRGPAVHKVGWACCGWCAANRRSKQITDIIDYSSPAASSSRPGMT